MVQGLDLKSVSNLNQLPMGLRRQATDYLAEACRSILENKVKLAYSINASKRKNTNFIPLEKMLDAIQLNVSYSPVGITLFIDEDRIIWDPATLIRENANPWADKTGFSFSYQDSIVGGAEEAFKHELQSMRENDWVLEEALRDINFFIKKDYRFYLENKILRGKK